jgi:hypothetical protein
MLAGHGARTAPIGSELAFTTCLGCGECVGTDPFQIWTMIGYYPCERSGSHLISVSALLHVKCFGIDADEIAARIRQQSAGCFEQ